MKNSLRIGSVMGIDIELHFTFMLLIAIIALFGVKFLVFILLLFLFVLIHELSHSAVAIAKGGTIKSITLLPIGGVASVEEQPENPAEEFLMSLAGPAINFVMGSVALAILIALGEPGRVLYTSLADFDLSPIGFLRMTVQINFLLGAFNLFVPALPMDGGRVLRSILAMRMDFLKATQISTQIAKFLAVLMFFVGISFNPWLVIISVFVYIGATQEAEMAKITYFLSGVTVRDVMSKDVVSIPPGMGLEELSEVMLRYKHMGYPVREGDNMVGIVTFNDLAKVNRDSWTSTLVGDVMTKEVTTIGPGNDIMDAFKILMVKNIGRVPVVEGNNIVGIISKTDIMRVIQVQRLSSMEVTG